MNAARPAPAKTIVAGDPRRPAMRKLAQAVALACSLGADLALAAPALPDTGTVVQGSASISNPTSSSMQVNVGTSKAVINWNGFSIGNGASVQFIQPGAGSVVLNRVTGSGASLIDGSLQANGQLFLVNPNGVFFGATSHVDVGGLIASTLDIGDNAFMNGSSYVFDKSPGSALGQVVNNGSINIASGGYAGLFGEQVVNGSSGVINTPAGKIALAVGQRVTVSLNSNQLLNFSVDQRALDSAAYVQNAGQLLADGGSVSMTAMVSNALASAVVNQSGLIRAQGVVDKNGEVYLSADGGNIEVSGSIETGALSGAPASTLSLSATGGGITVTSTGSLSANGATGANMYVVATGAVSLNGSISAQSSEGGTNLAVQGSSIALNSANVDSSAFLSSYIIMDASAGGITQNAGGILHSATTASVQDAAAVGGYAFAGINLTSTGAQNLGGTVSASSHGPQGWAVISAASSQDSVTVNNVSVNTDGGGNYANLSLSAAGDVTTTGNLSAAADSGPATSIIAAGGSVQLGGNLSVQGASASNSATLASISAGTGDVRMAPGTSISVSDSASGTSAGAGLSVNATQGQLVLADIGVSSGAGPAQTQLYGANGVTITGNVGTIGNSAQIDIGAAGSAVVVDAGKTVQATGTGGNAQLNVSTPGGSLQIDGSLQTQTPGGGIGRITTNPASPWATPDPILVLADPSQELLGRLLTIARTTPSNPLAGNSLIVLPSWNIVGFGPLSNGSMDAALYEDDGQDSIVPTSEIKGDGAPINAAMIKR